MAGESIGHRQIQNPIAIEIAYRHGYRLTGSRLGFGFRRAGTIALRQDALGAKTPWQRTGWWRRAGTRNVASDIHEQDWGISSRCL